LCYLTKKETIKYVLPEEAMPINANIIAAGVSTANSDSSFCGCVYFRNILTAKMPRKSNSAITCLVYHG
jgi:hypothetical protein